MDKVNAIATWVSRSRTLTANNPTLPGRRRRAPRGCPTLACTILLLLATLLPAQEVRPTEFQVKAAYLYNFGKFVRWPAHPGGAPDSFNICILGKDPFGAVLDSTVAGESIDGKQIAVRRVATISPNAQCSVLFISSSEEGHLAAVLAAAQQSGLLTVSDMRNFAERGGAIGLLTAQGKIRFEVNRKAAEQSRLVLSSELLKVAVKVIEK
ncbi:MAG: YfiR family protein [Candidatus Sulfotelmatobacter sp.]